MSTSSTNSLGGVGGFNSGLDINGIIDKLMSIEHQPIDLMNQKVSTLKQQQTAFSSVQAKVYSLYSSIKTLTQRDFNGKTMFDNVIANSSDNTIATASVTTATPAQTFNLEVKTLPSSTTANSTGGISKVDTTLTMSQLGVTDGSFTLYSGSNSYTINVASTDTLDDVFATIHSAIPEINADPTISNGKVSIAYTGAPATKIQFGSGGDTSNFLSKLFLNTAIDDGNGNITSSQPISTFNRTIIVTDPNANTGTPIASGSTFKINGVSFSVDGKSLNTIIDEINKSSANVTASFNPGNDTFTLTSTKPGSGLISLEETTGNFLTAMKLVNGTDTISSQKAGTNAQFVLNGATMYSTSSTVPESVTGIPGLTLNLQKAQPGTTVQISISKDTDSLVKAVQDVISKYNDAINFIDQQTKVDTSNTKSGGTSNNNGPLAGNNTLKSFRTQLRQLFSQQVAGLAGTAYDSLQQVGITTGPVGSGAGGATAQLQVDESKLRAALNADPNSVKKLFVAKDLPGTTTTGDDGMDGAFTKIYNFLTDQTYTNASGNTGFGVLYSLGSGSKGLFATFQDSANNRIQSLQDSITKGEARLAIKEQTLRQQYLAMDQLVGQYQQQGSAISGIISRLSSG